MMESMQDFFQMLTKYYPYFLKGTGNTLLLSLLGTMFGFLLGMILAMFRINPFPKNWVMRILQKVAVTYIEVIRGTPLLVQILIVFNIVQSMERFPAGVIAISMNSAAYVAEIIRAGIQSIDKGQSEAARSLGMPVVMTYREIILPQAIKNVLPALGNEFIVLVKETAIISVVGVMDLVNAAGIVQSKTYQPMPPLWFISIVYLTITFTISKGIRRLERRLGDEERAI